MVQLDERDLKIHLRWFKQRDPAARVFAVHFEGRPPVDEVEIDGQCWRFRQARSDLAMRSILVDEDQSPVVILTTLRNSTLEADIKGRIGGGEVLNFDVWQPLAMLFEATGIDGRLKAGEYGDVIAETLVRIAATKRLPTVVGGFLDEETAWHVIQHAGLGQNPVAEELSDWLVWAVKSEGQVEQLFAKYGDILPALGGRLESKFGAAGRYFMSWLADEASASVGAKRGVTAMARGLVLDAAFRAEARGEGGKAPTRIQVKLERQGRAPRDYAEECSVAWKQLADDDENGARCEMIGAELDRLLRELSGDGYRAVAANSIVSDVGWEERVRRLVAAIEAMLDGGADKVEQVRSALDGLREHSAATKRRKRLDLLENLGALAFRLVHEEKEQPGLEELGHHYVRDGSFIDAAREKLTGADLGAQASALREKLIDRALARSESYNERFATLLADELRNRRAPRQGVGIQDALAEAVAPIAKEEPVLLLVLDGLNWAVARWLLFDDALSKWDRFVPGDETVYRPLYATVPSVTKHSRTSLLTGKLQAGQQRVERDQFARAIRDAGGIEYLKEAALFHKKELDASGRGHVGDKVREAILDTDKQVVGVVVNAIDDQLGGAEQVDLDWSVDAVTPLRSLLELGRNRVVILVGDHGHVWETKTTYQRVGGESARWRGMAKEQIEGERVFSGPMITELMGEPQVLAAWSEKVRYTQGNRGYHGGASMQEILTPLIALVRGRREVALAGYRPLNPERPNWWELKEAPEKASVGDRARGTAPSASPQLSLISEAREGGDGSRIDTRWIEALVQTERFRKRMEKYGRGLDGEFVANMLAQLEVNGDKLGLSELADLADLPSQRMRSRLVVLRQVLNREGYQAVRFNRMEGLVELNRPMLERQFGLEER